MYTFEQTKKGYAHLYDTAEIVDAFNADAVSVARRIINAKPTLMLVQNATGVPWWVVGCILYRESNLDFSTYLGNGQSLTRRTTAVPAGRGPFASFLAGAVDAIDLEGFPHSGWTIERVLYWWERFNGQGYFGKHVNDPYLWSWTNLYTAGKFTGDGVFNASFKDPQGGCAAIMIALFRLDPTARIPRETAQIVSQSPPAVAPKPVAAPTEQKPMTDTPTTTTPATPAASSVLTTIDHALSAAQNELPTIVGFLSTFIPQLKAIQPFLNLLPIAINAVHAVEQATGVNTTAATSAVVSHLTPGQPDAPALQQSSQGTSG